MNEKSSLFDLGPVLPVMIGKPLSDALIPQNHKFDNHHALVDTGANIGGIDPDIAEKMDLPWIDSMDIGGWGGVNEHDVYAASVLIVGLDMTYHSTRLVAAPLPQHSKVLLGRDFLRHVVMLYDGMNNELLFAKSPTLKVQFAHKANEPFSSKSN